jgi:hypothetical protein
MRNFSIALSSPPVAANTSREMIPPEDRGDPRGRFEVRSGRVSDVERPGRPASQGAPISGRLLTVEDRCWQCRSKVRAIVGVSVDPEYTGVKQGFLPFDAVGEQLAREVDRRTLAARRVGELKHRESPGVPGGYLSNGCVECDALIGRFHLEDLLHEHLMGGGTLAQLDIGVPVELPLGVPRRLTALG